MIADAFADLPDPCLVVLCGPAGSGKSLLAAGNWPGKVVSSDAMRALAGTGEDDMEATAGAFELLHRAVALRLARPLTTVADATNVVRAHRNVLVCLAVQYRVPAVAVVLQPSLGTCLERNERRLRFVPPHVIIAQYARLAEDPPTVAEGFARVIRA